MTSIDHLLSVVSSYCAAKGCAESTLSSHLFTDGKRIAALRSGRDIGARRLQRAMQWLSDNWPEGAVWPADVARPASGGMSPDN